MPARRDAYDGLVDADDRNARPHLLVQATVTPLDEDGVVVAIIGTVAFAVAGLASLAFRSRLTEAGYHDWLWICLAGTALGVVGTAYCLWRRSRRAASVPLARQTAHSEKSDLS